MDILHYKTWPSVRFVRDPSTKHHTQLEKLRILPTQVSTKSLSYQSNELLIQSPSSRAREAGKQWLTCIKIKSHIKVDRVKRFNQSLWHSKRPKSCYKSWIVGSGLFHICSFCDCRSGDPGYSMQKAMASKWDPSSRWSNFSPK